MAELKPCPFCGKSVAEIDHQMDLAVVVCPQEPGGCGAEGGFGETTEQAAAAWNTRAPCPECDRQRERANEAVLRAASMADDLARHYQLRPELEAALGVAGLEGDAQLEAALERVAALEAVAARAVADLPSLRLGKVMGSDLPEHENLFAALAALDAKPQQGQEGER